jgi:hypothetical protein
VKFQLGQEVCTKRIGNPNKGIIAGIIKGEFFANLQVGTNSHFHRNDEGKLLINREHPWFKYNENWPIELVYIIELEEPDRAYSLVEFCNAHKVKSTEEVTKIYLDIVPLTYNIYHPECDIELWEENNVNNETIT